jgi:ketosteroid isomerase-like protein
LTLSPEITALVDAMTVSMNRGDKAGWGEGVSPDVIVEPVPGWPDPGPFVGIDEAWDFFTGIERAFAEVGPNEVLDVFGESDRLVIVFRRVIRVEGGEPTPVDVFMAATVANGKFNSLRSFYTEADAREKLGL